MRNAYLIIAFVVEYTKIMGCHGSCENELFKGISINILANMLVGLRDDISSELIGYI